MELQEQVDLTPFNSFGVAARAAWYGAVGNLEELTRALDFAREQRLPVQILGGGTNVLFTRDFPGLVLRQDWRGITRLEEPGRLRVAAGEDWHGLVEYCLVNGLHGLENLALIPGTAGAAPIQNIGAYGAELADFFLELSAWDREQNALTVFDREACEFAYRDSIFKQSGERYVVLSMTLDLQQDWQPNLAYPALRDALAATPNPAPRAVFEAVCAIRRSKLPDPAVLGNAGSFFKNPLVSREKYQALLAEIPDLPSYPVAEEQLVKLPAAWLLDRLGWKGRQRGRAAVHDRHALVLVNPGEASGEDLLLLAQAMSSSVLERFGIALEPEVRII